MTNDNPDGGDPGAFPGLAAVMQTQADQARELQDTKDTLEETKRILDALLLDPSIGPAVDGTLRLRWPMRVTGPVGSQYVIVREAGGNLATATPPADPDDWSDSEDAPVVSSVVSHDDLEDVTSDQHHTPTVAGGGTPDAHASTHERAGSDELDGDHLDIDFTPSNYTPATTPAEAAHVDDLAAHLQGIDTALAALVASQGDTLVTHIESVTTTAEQLIAARSSGYRSVKILNMDASGILYVGEDSGVGPTDGFELIGGASLELLTEDAIWVEADGTIDVGYAESYIA